MKIGLLGATGYFGSNILELSENKDKIEPISRKDFDFLTNRNYIDLKKYDVIINCAAMTDQNKAHTDADYRLKMYSVNGFGPPKLINNYGGHLIHVSSYFVLEPNCNDYSISKTISHLGLMAIRAESGKNISIVTPSQPYGGVNSNNYWGLLKNSLNKDLVLDNINKFNIIHIKDIVKTIDKAIEEAAPLYFSFEKEEYTKYTMACKLFGERDNWKAGEYKDIAPRPRNAVFKRGEHYV